MRSTQTTGGIVSSGISGLMLAVAFAAGVLLAFAVELAFEFELLFACRLELPLLFAV